MLAPSFGAALFGGLLGLCALPADRDVAPAPPTVDNCTGTIACVTGNGVVGPLSVVFVAGTGHRNGTCGCIGGSAEGGNDDTLDCREAPTGRCHANFFANVHVGIGNTGLTGGGCKNANQSGDVQVNVGCAGCGCQSTVIVVEQCGANCQNCGQPTAVSSGCTQSQCGARNC